jgi:hypothetical protein
MAMADGKLRLPDGEIASIITQDNYLNDGAQI